MPEVGGCVVVHIVVALADIARQDDGCGSQREQFIERVAHPSGGVHDLAKEFAFFHQVEVGYLYESQGWRRCGHGIILMPPGWSPRIRALGWGGYSSCA